MKTLIENSINVKYVGKGPVIKTIFTITDENEKKAQKYVDLSWLSGSKTTAKFSYIENDETKEDVINLDIPRDLDELAVKNFIIEQINLKLNVESV
jgi:hypothetical protein